MTNEDTLREAGLSDDEISEMSWAGSQINGYQNVNSIDELAQKYLDAGMVDDAIRILALKDDAVTYMADTIEDVTGWHVSYNDSVQQWINADTGQFMGKIAFWRELTDDEYDQAIIDKFGYAP